MASILIADDEKSLREFLTIMLENDGHEVNTVDDGERAVKLIRESPFDLIITDIRMKRSNGIEVLEAAKKLTPNTPVVMMTAYASAETAVEAMKKGAYDYISKPFKIEDLQLIIKNAVEKKKLSDENLYLKSALKEKFEIQNIVGRSAPMKKVFDLIGKVADSNATVLITGESGTGKELVAKAVHIHGARKNYPFISINCGAMPENLLESELFGHEKGAFTSADTMKSGLMEAANKGSFFLDEVAEAPLSIQVKLLRVLQEREFTRVGGTRPIHVDLRIIAASNRDLGEAVRSKSFREDLYYRLNVIPIHIPALRERKEDIPFLVDYFISKYSSEHQSKSAVKGIDPNALKILEHYHWPGNVRELENVIERAVVLETHDSIQIPSLPDEILQGAKSAPEIRVTEKPQVEDLEGTLDQIEKVMILDALNANGGNIQEAARQLDLTVRSLRYRLAKFDINPEEAANDPEGLRNAVISSGNVTGPLEKTLDRVEKDMILNALQKTDGTINKAAGLLKLSFRSLRYRLQKHNIRWKFDVRE